MIKKLAKLKQESGWIKTGSNVSSYETGFDDTVQREGRQCGCIRSKFDEASGFATLMKMSDAGEKRGCRIRMSVWAKTESVNGIAGAWMRVDGRSENPKQKYLAFDNMYDRPIVGTTDWTMYEIVLDVNDNATNIAYGVLLNGSGSVWLDDFQFEEVDNSVPTTGQSQETNSSANARAATSKTKSEVSDTIRLPAGWIKAGSSPSKYDMGIDKTKHHSGTRCSVIRSLEDEIDGFGTLMQTFDAGEFRGKRLKLSAFTKTKDVNGWAGVWMRVDGPKNYLSFDNMQDRPINGTTDWVKHEIVLDVPEESTDIAFGVLLNGTGATWMDDFQFEVVDKATPTTGTKKKCAGPTNLNFET